MLYLHQIKNKLIELFEELQSQGRFARPPIYVIRLNSPVHRVKIMSLAAEIARGKGMKVHEFRFTSREPLIEQLERESGNPKMLNPELFLINSFDENVRDEQTEIRVSLLFESFIQDTARIPAPLMIWMPAFIVDILYRRAPFFWKVIGGKVTDFNDQNDVERIFETKRELVGERESRARRITALEVQLEEAREKIGVVPTETISLMKVLSQNYFEDRQYEKAFEIYNEILGYYTAINDKIEKATTLYQIGLILQIWGCYDQSVHSYRESLQLFSETGNKPARADVTQQIARLYQELGEFDLSIEYYTIAITEQQGLGKIERAANALLRLGSVYEEVGIFNKAVEKYRESFELGKQHTNYRRMAIALLFTARIYEEKTLYKEAIKYFFAARSLFEKLGLQHKEYVESSLETIEKLLGKETYERYAEEARKNAGKKTDT
ncbi:MAG: tetratricopeptide repeat protein [Chloroherpetonaceae bacterium]|nr:tetratricopeptide repeat protein [Chloroherpetonaceae bacterium]